MLTLVLRGNIPLEMKIQSSSPPPTLMDIQVKFVVHKTFLELNSKTALQHSAKLRRSHKISPFRLSD